MVHEQEIQDGRFMEMRQTKLDDGGVVRTYTDTTDRKQAEEILRESEERLLAMLDGSPVGVRIVRDSDSIIIFANARMEELFHLSKEDFLGTKTGDYHVDLNNQEAIVARFRKEGFVRDAEVQMKRPDGGTFWALLSIAPFEYEGEPARLVWFYEITKLKETEEKLLEARSELESRVEERTQELRREIVERQNAEEKLRNAEKMQALGTLAGGIAHNFNNALVPIIALSGIVQRKIPKENPNHEMLGKIAEGAERAQDLVAQIMSFSRQDESKLENVDATALV
jgi:PAS domain S-box-containing protein